MDLDTKVHFTLSIGFQGARHEETISLRELGYDPEHDGDVEKFINECWLEWCNNYIDGGASLEV